MILIIIFASRLGKIDRTNLKSNKATGQKESKTNENSSNKGKWIRRNLLRSFFTVYNYIDLPKGSAFTNYEPGLDL